MAETVIDPQVERMRQLESLQDRLAAARERAKVAELDAEKARHQVALLGTAIENFKAAPL